MDIADIEMVIVHGVPDTVSQFYQVMLECTYIYLLIDIEGVYFVTTHAP